MTRSSLPCRIPAPPTRSAAPNTAGSLGGITGGFFAGIFLLLGIGHVRLFGAFQTLKLYIILGVHNCKIASDHYELAKFLFPVVFC